MLSNYTVSATSEDRKFSLSPGVKRLALVYVNNQIQVYHNNGLGRGVMLPSLVHLPGMRQEAREMLEELGVDSICMKQRFTDIVCMGFSSKQEYMYFSCC